MDIASQAAEERNVNVPLERIGDLIKSSGAIYFASALFGGSFGVMDAFARGRPIISSAWRVSNNIAAMSTATYVLRDTFKTIRAHHLRIPDKQWWRGTEGAAAGAVVGFATCRYVGGYRGYAYVGAAWVALAGGVMDALLSQLWKDWAKMFDDIEQRKLLREQNYQNDQ